MHVLTFADCDNTSGHMIDCLRQKSADEIANAHNAFFDWEANNAAREPMNQFSPRPDPEAEDPFLPEHPFVAMQKGHINDVPYMLGYAEKEGNWRVNSLTPDGPKGLQLWTDFVHGIDKLLPLISGIFDNNSNEDKGVLMKKLKKYYNIENMSRFPRH